MSATVDEKLRNNEEEAQSETLTVRQWTRMLPAGGERERDLLLHTGVCMRPRREKNASAAPGLALGDAGVRGQRFRVLGWTPM